MSASNRLPILQDEIRTAHAAVIGAAQTAVERARDAGTRLIEAKGLLGHGEWLPWLKETGVSPRTAQKYMRLVRHNPDINAAAAHLTIDGVLDAIAEHSSTFTLPEVGQIAYGWAEVTEYREEAYVWPSDDENFFHILSYLDYPPDEVSSTGIAATAITTKKPVWFSIVLQDLMYRGFPLDSAVWEIVEADPAPLEELRLDICWTELAVDKGGAS